MSSGFEITCINKNPNGMIVRIGGQGWSLGIREATTKLLTKQLRFNLLMDGKYVDIGVRGDSSDAFLVIEPDGYALHEVTGLASC